MVPPKNYSIVLKVSNQIPIDSDCLTLGAFSDYFLWKFNRRWS